MKLHFNAKIHTMDKQQPTASAILIAGGRVIAVGGKEQLESIAHGKVEKQDMKGKTIRERAKSLISIAHPNFKPQLIEEWEKRFKTKY